MRSITNVGVLGKVIGDVDFGGGSDADHTGHTVNASLGEPGTAVQGSFSNYELKVDDSKF